MKNSTLTVCLCLLFLLSPKIAAETTVAILDSGIDFRHSLLRSHQFINPGEVFDGQDNDGNGFVDDISGWNLIDQNPTSFERQSYPHFSSDFERYYLIRKKRTLNTSTEEEDDWYWEKRKDDEFQEKRSIYRRFIHGTHVAGLARGHALEPLYGKKPPQGISLLSFTYLGDTTQGPAAIPEFEPIDQSMSREAKARHLVQFIRDYLLWQERKLAISIDYASSFSRVVNGSFGVSFESGTKKIEHWWDQQFPGEKPPESWPEAFMEEHLKLTERIAKNHPHVLFVFSAGNSKDDTDKLLHYPSGAECENCLSVGASWGSAGKAYFSNYGKKSVHLFAPGVAMESTIPDNGFLPVNGTSQAAPQAAFAAGWLFEKAKSLGIPLSGAGARSLLLDSVDLKTNLKNQCVSSGILNPLRAVKLLELAARLPYERARSQSYQEVPDLNWLPEGLAPQKLNKEAQALDLVDPLF